MPRPRFQKLDESRRDNILIAAANAFAADGYHGASINQILETAGLSKGVAYYYFEDKADLFATTVEYYFEQFHLPVRANIDKLTPDNFWQMSEKIYQEPLLQSLDKPYMFGVMKAAIRIPRDDPIMERIMPIIEAAFGWMRLIIVRGQEFGVVRTDLPDELLYGYIMAIDEVTDTYLAENLDSLDREKVLQIVSLTVDALRRLLTP